jgi:hypothetical protein
MNPLVLKYGAYALVVIGIFGVGYWKGYAPEHDKLISFQAKVTQEANDQNAAAKRKDAENETQTLAVANAYTVDNNRLRAALEQLRKSTNSFSKLPKAADGSQGSDGAKQELSGTCQGSEFYANALEDALKLQKWQEWAERLNLSVE